ncbi:hypothetical protein BFG60_4816 [Microcystis aeruginosa NIES-98]|nr:hypothetical protein BFG60_4816 [Microcystis aeruginosa NIES-98]
MNQLSVIRRQETPRQETPRQDSIDYFIYSPHHPITPHPTPHTPHPTPHTPLANSCKPEIVH